MSWGTDGEEIRDRAKTELTLVKIPLYRLHQAAQLLKHSDKGPRMRILVTRVYDVLGELETLLRQ